MKNKLIKIMLLTLIVIALIISTTISVLAQDDRMPEIEDNLKSLKIEFYIEKSGVKTPIQGAVVSVYRISDLEVQGGSAEYIVLDKYSQLKKLDEGRDVTFNGITATQSEKLAKAFSQIVSEPEFTEVTDAQGECNFNNLEQGMYIVKEETATLAAKDYEIFAPYLISVPLAQKSDEGNQWLYSVVSAPKTTINELPTEVPTELPTATPTSQKSTLTSKNIDEQTKTTIDTIKTGEALMIILPLLVIWLLAFIVVKIREKKVKDNDES